MKPGTGRSRKRAASIGPTAEHTSNAVALFVGGDFGGNYTGNGNYSLSDPNGASPPLFVGGVEMVGGNDHAALSPEKNRRNQRHHSAEGTMVAFILQQPGSLDYDSGDACHPRLFQYRRPQRITHPGRGPTTSAAAS